MKSKIILKLDELISKGINSEPEVYYIIGQSRKYLEQEFPVKAFREKEYPTLSLFEDWILHSMLDGPGAQRKLSEYAAHLKKANGERKPFDLMTNISIFADLKTDLLKFCSTYGLSSKFLLKNSWKKFLILLIEILKDIPLFGGKGCYINKFVIKDDDSSDSITFVVNSSDGLHGEYQIDFKIISELHPAYQDKK